MVQQVLGETRGKCDVEVIEVSGASAGHGMTACTRAQVNIGGMGNLGDATSPNLQQPYYQVHTYGPGSHPVPDTYFSRPKANVGEGYHGMSENVRELVARTLREFGLELKGRARTYHKTYPKLFDTVPYPRGFRVRDFVKFTAEDSTTSYKHVEIFLTQSSNFGITNVNKIRLLPLPLSGTAFNWFISLAPNTVNTWEGLKQKFMNISPMVRLSLDCHTLRG
jgi:hypothetical protein